jgi:hypothetical protein
VKLPKDVLRVVARGKIYLYYQRGRGTSAAAERVKLPSDHTSPEFWQAYAEACSTRPPDVAAPETPTMAVRFTQYIAWLRASGTVTMDTARKYELSLRVAERGIGHMEALTVRPHDVRLLLDQFMATPGAGNNILGALRACSAWGVERGYFEHSFTDKVKQFRSDGGHRPWTPAQCAAADAGFTGMVRRAYFLARYTGQRGSDVVLFRPAMIDDGGFRITQKKTGREIWCPIDPALAAEMATWPRDFGLYLQQQPWGKVYSRKLLTKQFSDACKKIPALAGVTFHGLRGTRVVELRVRGATTLQIQDQVGMSVAMIERYCRFADKKASGKATVIALADRNKNRT